MKNYYIYCNGNLIAIKKLTIMQMKSYEKAGFLCKIYR